MSVPHVVIVGAGFGGVYTARRLASAVRKGMVRVTLVNRTNYFLFTPLLHEVATGGLSPTSVSEPLREVFAGTDIRIMRGEVRSVDVPAKTVTVEEVTVPYDYLVLSTGAASATFGIPGAEEHALPLKTLMDAVRIRGAVIDAYERAYGTEAGADGPPPSFIVVGGGATGVEIAAELVEFTRGMERRYHGGAVRDRARITLVNRTTGLLDGFPSRLGEIAVRRFRAADVALRLGSGVTEIGARYVVFDDGSRLDADAVIWTAGVAPTVPPFEGFVPKVLRGRIGVDDTLAVPGADGVFALGDAAAATDTDGDQLPLLAQVAVAQADTVAANILRDIAGTPLGDFRYSSKGTLVSLGQWFAVGDVFGATLKGRFAWWLWRTVYLFKFLSWRKRIRIAFEWTWRLFATRDTTRLET